MEGEENFMANPIELIMHMISLIQPIHAPLDYSIKYALAVAILTYAKAKWEAEDREVNSERHRGPTCTVRQNPEQGKSTFSYGYKLAVRDFTQKSEELRRQRLEFENSFRQNWRSQSCSRNLFNFARYLNLAEQALASIRPDPELDPRYKRATERELIQRLEVPKKSTSAGSSSVGSSDVARPGCSKWQTPAERNLKEKVASSKTSTATKSDVGKPGCSSWLTPAERNIVDEFATSKTTKPDFVKPGGSKRPTYAERILKEKASPSKKSTSAHSDVVKPGGSKRPTSAERILKEKASPSKKSTSAESDVRTPRISIEATSAERFIREQVAFSKKATSAKDDVGKPGGSKKPTSAEQNLKGQLGTSKESTTEERDVDEPTCSTFAERVLASKIDFTEKATSAKGDAISSQISTSTKSDVVKPGGSKRPTSAERILKEKASPSKKSTSAESDVGTPRISIDPTTAERILIGKLVSFKDEGYSKDLSLAQRILNWEIVISKELTTEEKYVEPGCSARPTSAEIEISEKAKGGATSSQKQSSVPDEERSECPKTQTASEIDSSGSRSDFSEEDIVLHDEAVLLESFSRKFNFEYTPSLKAKYLQTIRRRTSEIGRTTSERWRGSIQTVSQNLATTHEGCCHGQYPGHSISDISQSQDLSISPEDLLTCYEREARNITNEQEKREFWRSRYQENKGKLKAMEETLKKGLDEMCSTKEGRDIVEAGASGLIGLTGVTKEVLRKIQDKYPAEAREAASRSPAPTYGSTAHSTLWEPAPSSVWSPDPSMSRAPKAKGLKSKASDSSTSKVQGPTSGTSGAFTFRPQGLFIRSSSLASRAQVPPASRAQVPPASRTQGPPASSEPEPSTSRAKKVKRSDSEKESQSETPGLRRSSRLRESAAAETAAAAPKRKMPSEGSKECSDPKIPRDDEKSLK